MLLHSFIHSHLQCSSDTVEATIPTGDSVEDKTSKATKPSGDLVGEISGT